MHSRGWSVRIRTAGRSGFARLILKPGRFAPLSPGRYLVVEVKEKKKKALPAGFTFETRSRWSTIEGRYSAPLPFAGMLVRFDIPRTKVSYGAEAGWRVPWIYSSCVSEEGGACLVGGLSEVVCYSCVLEDRGACFAVGLFQVSLLIVCSGGEGACLVVGL